jgi:Domain of unknown function (DUF4160)
MPTISMFYGILVLMFYRDNRQHHSPHIHVRYQGAEAVIGIPEGELISGEIPGKQLKLVQAGIVDWGLAVNGDEPFRIAPLQ